MTGGQRYTRFRAPSEDGEKLAVPRWRDWPDLVESNRRQLGDKSAEILGRPIAELAQKTRGAVIAAAAQHTAQYLDSRFEVDPQSPLIATGHQPELYHPGVWLKNAAAAELAKQCGGVALNVVIDSDLARSPAIRVPTIDNGAAAYTPVAFDRDESRIPHEERRVVDPELLDSFAARVADAGSTVLKSPLLSGWWPSVVGRCRASGFLSRGIAEARHRLEDDWGIHLLQAPLSTLAETPGFLWLVAALIHEHQRVPSVYNECLADYRRAHRLRTDAQPMPDLAVEDGWLELPLWAWTEADPTRRGVTARLNGDAIELSNRQKKIASLPAGDPASIADALATLAQSGVKLRTRALMTTAFLRYFVGDLFIHGIGGAKYDQVTDRVCASLFGSPPPPHATLSGTLRLPVEVDDRADQRAAEAAIRLRNARYHPERLISAASLLPETRRQAEELARTKAEWVATEKTAANATERHRAIENANASLQQLIEPVRTEIEQSLDQARRDAKNARVLGSREYSFCLFPEERVRKFLLDF